MYIPDPWGDYWDSVYESWFPPRTLVPKIGSMSAQLQEAIALQDATIANRQAPSVIVMDETQTVERGESKMRQRAIRGAMTTSDM